jgi:hypothetical protein
MTTDHVTTTGAVAYVTTSPVWMPVLNPILQTILMTLSIIWIVVQLYYKVRKGK